MSLTFNNSWLGYDLPYDTIENLPSVQALRQAEILKRVKTPEFHVTVGYFKQIELDELATTINKVEQSFGGSLAATQLTFDGYGAIEQAAGKYVYFTLDPNNGREAFTLRRALESSSIFNASDNSDNLHLSIGGPDPFGASKPKQAPLQQPFSIAGRLIFVGNDGKQFRKYAWENGRFTEITNPETKPTNARQISSSPEKTWSKPAPKPIHTIAIFPKIQADTATAVYLLKAFGEEAFPGAAKAQVVFWSAAPSDKTSDQLEAEGILTLDLGGRFDHHLTNQDSGKRTECASTLIAKYLGADKHPALQKLLAWTKRDDLEGKGTISNDALDRAFGLSGVIMNLNREYTATPQKILDLILPVIAAHVREEYRRQVELPQEWERLENENKAHAFTVRQGSADLVGVLVESDNVALAGFLRAAKKVDLVIQRRSTGHTNLVTQQLRSLDLRPTIAALRQAEIKKQGRTLDVAPEDWSKTGRLDGVDEWFYDDAANTLQNGGINPQGISPTALSKEEILAIITQTIPQGVIGALKRQKDSELN